MKTVIHKAVLSLAVLLCSAAAMTAQEPPDQVDGEMRQRRPTRPNIMRQLGLNRQQMKRLREINQSWRPMIEGAQHRFREANKRLDEAIYADHLDEAAVHDRIREVQLSQAEIVKLRSTNEVSIRKILTPEQLTRFRSIRQRFEDMNSQPGRRAVGSTGPEIPPQTQHD